jgi:hypothetical protein
MTTTRSSATTAPFRGAAIGIGLALVANLVVFFAANALLDGSIQVMTPGTTTGADLPLLAVVLATVVPLLVGGVTLWLLTKMTGRALAVWSVVAAVVAVASLAQPLVLDVDAGSKVALSIMHLATGAMAIVGQRRAAGG